MTLATSRAGLADGAGMCSVCPQRVRVREGWVGMVGGFRLSGDAQGHRDGVRLRSFLGNPAACSTASPMPLEDDQQQPGAPGMSAPVMTFVVTVREHQRTIKRKPPQTRSTSSPAPMAGKARAAMTEVKDKKKPAQLATTTGASLSGKDRVSAKPAKPRTPESCGKQSDPHDVDGGALARRGGHISTKRRRKLDRHLNDGA